MSRDVTWGEWHGRITEMEHIPLFQQAGEIPIQLETEDIHSDQDNNVADQTYRIVLWDTRDTPGIKKQAVTQAKKPEDIPTNTEEEIVIDLAGEPEQRYVQFEPNDEAPDTPERIVIDAEIPEAHTKVIGGLVSRYKRE